MWGRVAKDNLKACLPFQGTLRRLARTVAPYASLPSNDALALDQGLEIVRLIRRHGAEVGTVLEVGTGWLPTIPWMLQACGSGRLILTDVEKLLDAHTAERAKHLVEEALPRLASVADLPEKVLRTNLDRSGIMEYRCPPRLDELPDASVDVLYSRAVLEHIAVDCLEHELEVWRRLLKPNGICIHVIDNSDHFEHRDKRLSRLNFLSLPDWQWQLACFNRQNYQNRLRHSDYIELFRDHGYAIVHEDGQPDQHAMRDVEQMRLNRRFAGRPAQDLAILTSTIVAAPDELAAVVR